MTEAVDDWLEWSWPVREARLRARAERAEDDRVRWQNRAIRLEELLTRALAYVKGGALRDAIQRELSRD